MKVIIIDYIAPEGHVGYNSYHASILAKLYPGSKFVSSKTHLTNCNLKNIKCEALPSLLYPKYNKKYKPLFERILGILRLIYIQFMCKLNDFDAIVFLSYDILSLFVFRTNLPVYIVNHNNTSDFKSLIKRRLHQRLPSNFSHIVLAAFIADYIKSFTKSPIHIVPHGLTKIYDKTISLEGNVCDGKYIYCPTTSSCNTDLLIKIIESDVFNSYMQANNIKIVIKSYTFKTPNNNVIVISDYVDDILYKKIMAGALAVFAPYTDASFQNRVSAILMECIGSKIPIISTYSQAYKEYSEFINYKFIVDSPDSFIECINEILSLTEDDYYKNIELLNPTQYWNQILQK